MEKAVSPHNPRRPYNATPRGFLQTQKIPADGGNRYMAPAVRGTLAQNCFSIERQTEIGRFRAWLEGVVHGKGRFAPNRTENSLFFAQCPQNPGGGFGISQQLNAPEGLRLRRQQEIFSPE